MPLQAYIVIDARGRPAPTLNDVAPIGWSRAAGQSMCKMFNSISGAGHTHGPYSVAPVKVEIGQGFNAEDAEKTQQAGGKTA